MQKDSLKAAGFVAVAAVSVIGWLINKQRKKNKYKFYDDIVPVDPSYDYHKEKPREYRPFKGGPFFMTMGVKRLAPDDWLLIEDTYDDTTQKKAEIVETQRDHTVLCNPIADEPLKEIYEMILDYMVKKYPMYFERDGDVVINKIKGTKLGKATSYQSAAEMVRTLSKNVEEDFLILVWNEEDQQYYLRGGSFAFPSGFDPAVKVNTPLSAIHAPVPFYKEKIQKSMDKYFAKMQPGQWVERFNWSFQTHTNYFALSENHAAEEEEDMKPLDANQLDFDKVFMRCERQILTRLPHTKSILFSIRTYITPLSKIRTEGRNEELIEAIDNLPDAMAHYKKRREWGEAVKSYLRFETDGIKT